MSAKRELPEKPEFRQLPLDKDGPRGNAWGLFGERDELGMLNYITPDVTREALKEISFGIRICTDLPLDFFKAPTSGRVPLKHNVWQLNDWAVNDDTITMNPQSSTQWDGFRHFGYQDRKQYYNGCTHGEIHSTQRNGVHVWHQNGGIATRGVLLDYAGWKEKEGVSPSCFQTTSITVPELRAVMAAQNVSLRHGDVLLIRSGYIDAYKTLTEEDIRLRAKEDFAPAIGLEQSEDMLKFLWDSGAVAISGDMPTLETWPWQNEDFWLHEWLLAGWGCPIGEYFNLEQLSAECKRLSKWTFFFTSTPLNVPGGVATPANGLAIL